MRTILAALAVLAGLATMPAAAQSTSGLSISSRVAAAEAAEAAARSKAPAPSAQAPAIPEPASIVLPVPAVAIYPGDTISDSMLVDRAYSVSPSDRVAVATSRQALIGKVARRGLQAGTPIPVNAYADPQVVSRGHLAPVVLQEGGLTISGFAMAMEDGSVGKIVRLKNLDSGLIIAGTVQSDGSVRVSGQ
ncbi:MULTISPECIES: flagellar basal body P-ring formation chaperone FlgA [Azorhizobium]|uniref:Flagella basal body P-ring formation protein FlgA n=1 Tax=Azorhizobium caulinodans (strain ATCC 43989 / DSM 5975 / JCM 20966 / LMG 6465 / NBRC 14845 / NCIMB 13405 / ORS 571) TaxID=438753 RepID=A8IPJ7_AZOC5|nr:MULTISPECIES: flagellar basal body P-ring formation chaperone FlgA [Azorhizobium]TDT88895.1 flagella basal body P-ring formation protein FlgA [Azorhizobium sp. AG788]BAF86631.1 flagellar basal-body P-ring formation protein [Azorhizobium caulinodans ORS 571]